MTNKKDTPLSEKMNIARKMLNLTEEELITKALERFLNDFDFPPDNSNGSKVKVDYYGKLEPCTIIQRTKMFNKDYARILIDGKIVNVPFSKLVFSDD